jgi:hypothetical protein
MKEAEDDNPQIMGGCARRQKNERESGWEKACAN